MDLNDPSIEAAKWVAQYLAPDATFVLAHVIDMPARAAFLGVMMPTREEVEADARSDAASWLRILGSALGPQAAVTEIRVGRSHEQLADIAVATRADLLVIGAHGDRRRPWKPLGTTAERVVRTSPVPVLVVRSPQSAPPRRLLVPVDDSDLTPLVLSWASDIAATFIADTTVLHVVSGAVFSHVASMAAVTIRDEGAAREHVDRTLRDEGIRWLEKAARAGAGFERLKVSLSFGDAGDEILTAARDMEADLIVMGGRATGPVRPALLGSTVSAVLHGSTCPVLVITEPLDALEAEG